MGTFVLWFGWFGFNGGSQLAISSTEDAIAVAKILGNTNMAAAAGVITALLYYVAMGKRIDVSVGLNGALAGLVAITAEPLLPSLPMAMVVGATGAVIMILAASALEKLKIDDVVGAVPVHLAAGTWGTIAVVLSNPEATLLTQLTGIVSVGAFMGISSLLIWAAMKYTIGIRIHWSREDRGPDLSELGVKAYYLEENRKVPV
jgi:Amt family ammonium transporter